MVILAMFWLSVAYLICFFLGLGYAVISAVFGAFGGDHGGADVGHDIGVDVADGGDMDLGGGHDVVAGADVDAADIGGHEPGMVVHGPAVNLLSPPIIAMTLVTFGGTGIIFTQLVDWGAFSLLPSTFSGITMGLLTLWFFYTFFRRIQGSSSPSLGEMIGLEAEATTPIPADGVGEIAYVVRSSRFTARAKSMGGQTLPSHSAVKIVKWVGHTAYVKPAE